MADTCARCGLEFRDGEEVWKDRGPRGWVPVHASSICLARLTAELAAAREREGLATRILRPIADEMAKVKDRPDYPYRTSSAGRACLNAYTALAQPPVAETGGEATDG